MSTKLEDEVARQASDIAVEGLVRVIMNFGATEEQAVAVRDALRCALIGDFGASQTILIKHGFDADFVSEFEKHVLSEIQKAA